MPPPLPAVSPERSPCREHAPRGLVMEAIVFSPLAEPQEVARKPGVRQGGLSPGGYRREQDYRFLFQPAPRETGRWPQKPPQGRGGVFKRGEAPFAPRGSAS